MKRDRGSTDVEKAAPGSEPRDGLKMNDCGENTSKYSTSSATHSRKAALLQSGAEILARSIFSAVGYRTPAVRTLEECLRVVLEDQAAFHRYKAERIRRGDRVRDNVTALFAGKAAA